MATHSSEIAGNFPTDLFAHAVRLQKWPWLPVVGGLVLVVDCSLLIAVCLSAAVHWLTLVRSLTVFMCSVVGCCSSGNCL